MRKASLHTLPRAVMLLLAAALLLTALILPAAAQEPAWEITDHAQLLTPDQLAELSARVRDLSNLYQTDFVVVTVYSLGSKSPQMYANDFYDDHQCGYGVNRDGILLLISTEFRDYYFLTNGAATKKLAQAGGIDTLEKQVVPHLSKGDYYAAISAYLDTASAAIADPTSIPGADYNDDFVYIGFEDIPTAADRRQRVGVFAVIGLIIGLVTTLLMKRSMKTARPQKMAMNYIRPGSFHLTRQQDIYLYRTRTRVRVQSNNSSRGGGRSGGSRGGGGGKF